MDYTEIVDNSEITNKYNNSSINNCFENEDLLLNDDDKCSKNNNNNCNNSDSSLSNDNMTFINRKSSNRRKQLKPNRISSMQQAINQQQQHQQKIDAKQRNNSSSTDQNENLITNNNNNNKKAIILNNKKRNSNSNINNAKKVLKSNDGNNLNNDADNKLDEENLNDENDADIEDDADDDDDDDKEDDKLNNHVETIDNGNQELIRISNENSNQCNEEEDDEVDSSNMIKYKANQKKINQIISNGDQNELSNNSINAANNNDNETSYCNLCKKEFCNKYFLKSHMSNKHGGLFEPTSTVYLGSTGSIITHFKYASPKKQATSQSQETNQFTQDKFSINTRLSHNNNNNNNNNSLNNVNNTPNNILDVSTSSSSSSLSSSIPSNSPVDLPSGVINNQSAQLNNSKQDIEQDLDSTSNNINLNITDANASALATEDYCDLCQKHFCNKYYLRKHKLDVHGIVIDNNIKPYKKHDKSNRITNRNLDLKIDSNTASLAPLTTAPLMSPASSSLKFSDGNSVNAAEYKLQNNYGDENQPIIRRGNNNRQNNYNELKPRSSTPQSLLNSNHSTSQSQLPTTPSPSPILTHTPQPPPLEPQTSPIPPHFNLPNSMSSLMLANPYLLQLPHFFAAKHAAAVATAALNGTSPQQALGLSGLQADLLGPLALQNQIPSLQNNAKHLNNMQANFDMLLAKISAANSLPNEVISSSSAPQSSSALSPPSQLQINRTNTSSNNTNNASRQKKAGDVDEYVNCNLCNKSFRNLDFLKLHLINKHGINDQPTNSNSSKNSSSSSSSSKMKENLKLASNETKNEIRYELKLLDSNANTDTFCFICEKDFLNKNLLKTHIIQKHNLNNDVGMSANENIKNQQQNKIKHLNDINDNINNNNNGLLINDIENQHQKQRNNAITNAYNSNAINNEQEHLKYLNDIDMFNGSTGKCLDKVICNICNKQLCNKYFLKTHKAKVHGVKYELVNSLSILSSNNNSIEAQLSNSDDVDIDNNCEQIKPESILIKSENKNDRKRKYDGYNEDQLNEDNNGDRDDTMQFQQQIGHEDEKENKKFSQLANGDCSDIEEKTNLNAKLLLKQSLNAKQNDIETSVNEVSNANASPSYLKAYCNLCNKELCNKYFLKSHMLNVHNINIDTIDDDGDDSRSGTDGNKGMDVLDSINRKFNPLGAIKKQKLKQKLLGNDDEMDGGGANNEMSDTTMKQNSNENNILIETSQKFFNDLYRSCLPPMQSVTPSNSNSESIASNDRSMLNGEFGMQPFLIESKEKKFIDNFVPCLVYLPVKNKIQSAINLQLQLKPLDQNHLASALTALNSNNNENLPAFNIVNNDMSPRLPSPKIEVKSNVEVKISDDSIQPNYIKRYNTRSSSNEQSHLVIDLSEQNAVSPINDAK